MGRILIIAEKPSVGKDIAKVLQCNKKADGYVYSDKYIVSWAIGHLVTLFDPEDYNNNLKKWSFDTLPIIPDEIKLKPAKNTEKQFNILQKLMTSKKVDSFICATDSGREGELIFRYIYKLIGSEKSFKRLWISSMTDKSIKEGFANLKDGSEYDNLYLSAKCRSEADWLVGINASRAYTIKYGALLSIGRVQTPTLAILVERQKEINTFVPKDYWEVIAYFDEYEGKWFDPKNNNDSKILKKEKALEIINKIKNQTGIVEKIENKEEKKAPPLLYDLTELQRDCNNKFSFSASKTLSIAQDLYEKRKMITYPRTDSRYLSNDMKSKVRNALHKLDSLDKYSVYTKYVLELDKLPYTKRIINDAKVTDHHAIIPTEYVNIKKLTNDELKVYDLIVKRFISVFYPYYIYNVTKITTNVSDERFLTKGNTIIQLGYMEIYKNDTNKKSKKNAPDFVLPKVKINDVVKVIDTKNNQQKTKPPDKYTEATLLSAMENAGRFVSDENLKEQLKESGLGTPATRASIIERLLTVGYTERKGKIITPTEKGMKLIEILPNELKSPETTGKWEKGLTSISKGKMQPDRFMSSINKYVLYIMQESQKPNKNIVFQKENYNKQSSKYSNNKGLGNCPICKKGHIFENSKAFFCSGWKSGCKFTIWKNTLKNYNVEVTQNMIIDLLKNRKIENVNLVLPQTKEKATADLILKEDANYNLLEFVNMNRMD